MADQQRTTNTGQDRTTRIKNSLVQLKEKCFPGLKYSLLISLIINFIMLVIGAVNVHKCPAKSQIPLFLIVIGSINIISHILTYLKSRPMFENTSLLKYLESCLYFTSLIFLALGSYWVYSIFKPSFNQNDGIRYCNKTAYLFAFIYLTIIWVIILAILLGFTCFIICICFAAATADQFQVDIEARRSDNNQSTQPLQTNGQ